LRFIEISNAPARAHAGMRAAKKKRIYL